MTRGTKAFLVAGLASLLVWATAAQDEPLRIGVVDLELALFSTDDGKMAKDELQRKKREAEGQIQPMVERAKAMQEEIEGKRYVLSDDALFAKQADLLELKNKIDNKYKELEGQLKIDQSRILAPLQSRLGELIEEIGKDQGFTLILARDTPGVIYSREAIDITDLVISRFNKKKS